MDSKKRIFTIEDLCECCIQNNITMFEADNADKRLVVSASGVFESEDDDEVSEKEGLLGLKAKIFHTGKNLNNSIISKENAEKYMNTIKDRPLLAYIHQLPDGSYDFKQHDRKITINQDGETEIEYIESPIGHFTSDDAWIEEDKDNKGRYYIYGKAVVYEEYTKAAEILKQKNGCDCSMEIEIQEFTFDKKNKAIDITSFFIRGVTLLGSTVDPVTGSIKKVQPGMEGAKVTLEDFMSKTQNEEDCVFENKQKGGNEEMNKLEELLQKYGKSKEDIDFDYEGMSDDELETKFSELFEEEAESQIGDSENQTQTESTEDETDETTPQAEDGSFTEKKKKKSVLSVNELSDGAVEVSFELSHDVKRSKIYGYLASLERENDCREWYYLTNIYDKRFIYQKNGKDINELYGQKYEFNDKDELILIEEPYKVHEEYLNDEEYTALNEMRASYETIKNELEEYKLKEQRQEKVNVLINDETFSKYIDEEEFKELMINIDKYSLDEFKDKADSAYGKLIKRNDALKEASFSMPRHQMFSFENSTDSPYGDLFKE